MIDGGLVVGGLMGGIGNIISGGMAASATQQAMEKANFTNLLLGRETNAQNLMLTREANELSSANAQKQMDFQERMSSTAHQRQVADMKAAGLNPMLSASQGGASAPTGANPTVQAGHMDRLEVSPETGGEKLGEGIGRAMGTALQVAQVAKDFEQKDAQIAATKAAEAATRAEMPGIKAKSSVAEAEAGVRKATAGFDKRAVYWDGISKRIFHLLGGVFDAVNIRSLIQGGRQKERDQIMREERHLDSMGWRGTRLP